MIVCGIGPVISRDFLLGDFDGRTKPECNDRRPHSTQFSDQRSFRTKTSRTPRRFRSTVVEFCAFQSVMVFLLRHDQRILAQPIAHLGHHHRPHVSEFFRASITDQSAYLANIGIGCFGPHPGVDSNGCRS